MQGLFSIEQTRYATLSVKAHKACTNLLRLQETTISCVESQPAKSGFRCLRADWGTGYWSCWTVKAVYSKPLLLPLIQRFSEWFAHERTFCLEMLWVTMRNASQRRRRRRKSSGNLQTISLSSITFLCMQETFTLVLISKPLNRLLAVTCMSAVADGTITLVVELGFRENWRAKVQPAAMKCNSTFRYAPNYFCVCVCFSGQLADYIPVPHPLTDWVSIDTWNSKNS